MHKPCVSNPVVMVLALCLLFAAVVHGDLKAAPAPSLRMEHQIEGDLMDIKKTVSEPPSDWIMSEKQLYQSAFGGKTYDILLVPFQNMAHPIALNARKMMTYRLALEIRRRSGMTVAPIHLVYRALGNTARSFDEEEVCALARKLGAAHILWGFAGYGEPPAKTTMTYTFSIIRQHRNPEPGKGASDQHTLEGVPGGSAELPTEAFTRVLDTVYNYTGLPEKTVGPLPEIQPSETLTIDLPETPLEMVRQGNASPLIRAYYLQLLGLLTPSSRSREIQREFFIRSLSLLWQVDASNADAKLLMARAFLYLDRRPMAVRCLGNPETPEAKAFKEFMNANLPSQEDHILNIQSPLKRLMARLEQYHLKAEYSAAKKKPEFKALVDGLNQIWQYLFIQKLTDHDRWSNQSNILLKVLMDREFPVDGLSMETQLKSATASGELEKKRLSFEMLFADHLWKAVRSEKTLLFSQTEPDGLSDYDYLLLLRAIGETNLLKYLHFYEEVQGKPETALQLANAFLPVFEGHPAFHLKKASILYTLYTERKSLTDREKSDLVKQLMESAFKGLWWIGQNDAEQGTYWTGTVMAYFENRISRGAFSFAGPVPPGSRINKFIREEYPPCGLVRLQHPGFSLNEKLEYIHKNLYRLEQLLTKGPPLSDRFLQTLIETPDRFRGNPEWPSLQAKINKRLGNYDALEGIYQTGIRDTPLVWENYEGLGLEYMKKGNYEKARNLFMQYPPFTGDRTDYQSVGLSNEAYMAGNHFFWRGDPDDAEPFYTISAELKTGSSASLTSQARMSMVRQDFTGSAQVFLQRAKRYNDKYAYRDYMSLMHIMGMSDQAWSVFDSLIGRFPTPQIWTSALVGHRMSGTPDTDVYTWLNDRNKLVRGKSNFPARFALIWLTDRTPDPSFADPIGEMENQSIFPTPKDEPREIKDLGISFAYPPLFLGGKKEFKTPVKAYQSIAQSYIYLKHGSYEPALETYKKLSHRFSLTLPAGRQLMPYIIFAAYKSGDKNLAGELIQNEFLTVRDYDTILSKAVLTGLRHDHANALDLFKEAFSSKPFAEDRLFFPWYQIVELLEWLYLDTREKDYLDLALSLAKAHQRIQPMFAWAFAFEAKYTKDPQARLRALAYAQYLDRNSEWISHFSDQEKLKASVWFEANTPFTPQGQAAIQKQLSL